MLTKTADFRNLIASVYYFRTSAINAAKTEAARERETLRSAMARLEGARLLRSNAALEAEATTALGRAAATLAA